MKLMALPKEGTPPVGQGATRQEILNEVKILAMIRHANCLMLKARARGGRSACTSLRPAPTRRVASRSGSPRTARR